MVKAMVDIDEHGNMVLNVVKAKYGLHDKSQAINLVLAQYEEGILEPELRPEFITRLKKKDKEPTRKVKDFRREFLS